MLAQKAPDGAAQVASGAAQVAPHAPPEQTWPAAQAVPHAPQLATFDTVSTHAPEQHCCIPGHPRDSVQPMVHTLPTQSIPTGQCSSSTHSTHCRVPTLQCAAGVSARRLASRSALARGTFE